jgi:rod shape-determining protein MreD
MNKRSLFWILTVLLGFIFQVTFADLISIYGIFPNLLLLGTIFFAICGGPIVGEWAGFCWGLLSDVASISIFGSQTFMLTLVGYIAGRLKGKIDEDKSAAQMSVVLFMSVFYILGLLFLETLFGGSVQRFKARTSYFQPIYSTLVCPLAFWILLKWRSLFFKSDFRIR